ncbi:MAG TPA: acyl-CoA thioesterase [Bacteroidales bacterium]|nr:acyl-CoA thioesterase [Bacteroidales bacterium]
MEESFPVRIHLRIDWSELDILGIINNLNIQKYAQAARVSLLEIAELMNLHKEEKIGPVIASTTCQFKKSLFYPGCVTVYSRIELIKNTSFGIVNYVYNDDNELVAQINDIIVLSDLVKKTKIPLPENLRKRLDALRSGSFKVYRG